MTLDVVREIAWPRERSVSQDLQCTDDRVRGQDVADRSRCNHQALSRPEVSDELCVVWAGFGLQCSAQAAALRSSMLQLTEESRGDELLLHGVRERRAKCLRLDSRQRQSNRRVA